MNDRNESSSSLDPAGRLSQGLCEASDKQTKGEALKSQYIKFSFNSAAKPAPVPAPSPVAKPRFKPTTLEGWNGLLDWCLNCANSHSVFVADSRGVQIANAGICPDGGFEGWSADLCYGVDRIHRLDVGAGNFISLEMNYDGACMLGISIFGGDDQSFLLGLISAHPLDYDIKTQVFAQIDKNLNRLIISGSHKQGGFQ